MQNIDEAIRRFVELRDERSKLKNAFEEADDSLKHEQTVIESFLLQQAIDLGIDKFAVNGVGTAYRRIKLRPMITDFDEFMDFVSHNKAYDAVQKRVNTSFVENYMEEHGGLPAGIGATRQYEIVIRRS